jgi:hypothetical protein
LRQFTSRQNSGVEISPSVGQEEQRQQGLTPFRAHLISKKVDFV